MAPVKLPEEFAPTGPKLSRFPIQPAPPVRPQLFKDEARFTLRICMLAGGAELAAWAWIAGGRYGWLAALLRLTRLLWSALGTRIPRPVIAFVLMFVALAAQGFGWSLFAAAVCGLCSLGDLCGTTLGDAITVERRPAAFGWLDIAQSLGVALGLVLGLSLRDWVPAIAAAALLLGSVGVPDLKDRGTPRSTWPLPMLASALKAPIGWQLCLYAALIGGFGLYASRGAHGWLAASIPLLGMGIAARLEPHMKNAVALPRALTLIALAGFWAALGGRAVAPAFGLLALGGAATALPASIARAAAEMHRAATSSLVWQSLALAAALAVL